jgi:hypothetical protein
MSSNPVVITPVCARSFERVEYDELGDKHKENYNFAKVSALLANFGFSTIRLTDDWHGVDFIAHNPNGLTLFVQLKGRFTIDKKYMGKQIYVCFPWKIKGSTQRIWFLYPHDELVEYLRQTGGIGVEAWNNNTGQSRKNPSKDIVAYLKDHGHELGVEGSS